MLVVLTVSDGPEEGRKLTLVEGQSITIGREAPADVVMSNDGYLSGKHFSVEVTNGTALLRDLESRNKTKVNGQFVREISLTAGDIVLAGHTEFLVDIQETAEQFETTLDDVDPNKFATPPGAYPAGGTPAGGTPTGGTPTGGTPTGGDVGAGDVAAAGDGGAGIGGAAPTGEGASSPPPGGDVFDAPFDEPTPNPKMAIGDPGVNTPGSSSPSGDSPLPPESKKKSSKSPIQSITGSGSPLFGGSGDAGDSGFGSPFGDVPKASGGSPLMSVTGGAGVGPVSPLQNHQPPPDRDYDSPSSFDPHAPTTPTPTPPSQSTPARPPESAPPSVTPEGLSDSHELGSPTDTPSAANEVDAVEGDATGDDAGAANNERKHFVADSSAEVAPLADVHRQCVRTDCSSGLVRLLAAGDGETDFKITSLLLELKKTHYIALSIHCQKGGLELPQELWSAIPLFDWLPRETSLFYCPVATTLSAIEEAGQLEILDQLWGIDAMVVFLAKRSEQEGLDYLAQLRHHSIPGITSQGNFMGFSWPSVIGQLLQHQAEPVVTGILGDQLSGVITEADDPKSWQFIGEAFMIDELQGLPLAVAEAES